MPVDGCGGGGGGDDQLLDKVTGLIKLMIEGYTNYERYNNYGKLNTYEHFYKHYSFNRIINK